MNENIKKNLIDFYTEHAYTDNYIFGFTFGGMVYASTNIHADDLLPYIMTLDKASRGQGYSIRFKPNKAQKAILMINAEPLVSVEYFDSLVADSKYNRGEIFEKLVTEQLFEQVWEKDNVPYTDGPDVVDGNIPYQVKFEKATFTNEKSMNLMR